MGRCHHPRLIVCSWKADVLQWEPHSQWTNMTKSSTVFCGIPTKKRRNDDRTRAIHDSRPRRLARVGRRRHILDRIDEVVTRARLRILEEEPLYQRLSPAELADVSELLYSNFRMLALAMSGGHVAREQLDYVGEHVRARVRMGIPLEAVIEAYRTGMNVFWEECTAEVAALGLSRDAAVSLARKMSEAMDTLTTHAAAAYVREESSLRASSERAARDLLDALLRGDVDAARVEPHGAAPGLDPREALVVVVGRVSTEDVSPTTALETAAAALAECLATRGAPPLLVVRQRAIVAVVPADDPDLQIARLTTARRLLRDGSGISLFCGFSTPCAGFAQVGAAYEQASLAVSRSSEERPVVSLATLPAVQHLLLGAAETTRAQLLERGQVIADLSVGAGTSLKQTIYAFARTDMNATKAAAHLRVHENTLRYRLRRIHEQTGHDPRKFDGLVELICLIETLDS